MTGSPTRFFVRRIAGAGLFTPSGEQVGKVRDVVATVRVNAAPRAIGLVVEVTGRRRVFVPLTRVTGIDEGTLVASGLVNLRRFQRRAGESLVLGDLLDRRVSMQVDSKDTAIAQREHVAVLDIAFDETAGGDWQVTKVFVRRPGKGLRRRGETLLVDWNRLSGFATQQDDQGVTELVDTFTGMNPTDIAGALHDLTPQRRAQVVAALADERLADIVQEMADDDRVEILNALGAERAADILEEMESDDAADLLGDLPKDRQESLLRLMDPEEADDVRRLMAYGPYTAGGMMTADPIVLPPDATVADALAKVRNADLNPAVASQVYVVRPPLETPTGRYLGAAHFQRLLRERPAALVSSVLDPTLEAVPPTTPLQNMTRLFAAYNLVALPVVENGRLVGAVTVDDVVDHMLPEDWRDPDAAGEA